MLHLVRCVPRCQRDCQLRPPRGCSRRRKVRATVDGGCRRRRRSGCNAIGTGVRGQAVVVHGNTTVGGDSPWQIASILEIGHPGAVAGSTLGQAVEK
jgi:hypothetical protein